MQTRFRIAIAALGLFINSAWAAPCFEPVAGENQWRMIARIGFCVGDMGEVLSAIDDTVVQIEQDLLSISDFLTSKIMDIDAGNDALLLSITDELISVIDSASSATDELIISVSDALTSKIMAIDAGNDELLLSVSDALTADMSVIDSNLLSISDALTSKIMAIDAGNDELLLSISDALTVDISIVETDLLSIGDELTTITVECCQQLNSKIDELSVCSSIPIFSGSITLSVPDQGNSYCLAENMFGNITIDDRDITVNLNGYVVFGSIIITDRGSNAIVRNGTISGSDPVDNTQAAFGLINIAAGATGVSILDCVIEAGAALGTGSVNGYDGINVVGSHALIRNCIVRSGQGGGGSLTGTGGNGGNAITINSALGTRIELCELIGGTGGGSLSATIMGAGGDAIVNNGFETTVQDCSLEGGAGGSLFVVGLDIADAITLTLGAGGDGVHCLGDGCTIKNCTIRGGNGGSAGVFTAGNIAINTGILLTGQGGDGVNNTGDSQLTISECEMYGGSSGSISAPGSIAIIGGAFTVSRGGHGIFNQSNPVSTNQPTVMRCVIRGGAAGSVNTTLLGDIGTLGTPSLVLSAGNGIESALYNLLVVDSKIAGGSGGDVRTVSGSIADVTMEGGGHGLIDSGFNTHIKNCTIISGAGGSLISVTLGDILATSLAGNGGHAVMLDSSFFALVEQCELIASIGGDALSTQINAGASGAGGMGVYITNTTEGAQIRSNAVGPTGASGIATGIGGTSLPGGDGIRIDAGAGATYKVEVSNCEISYTGAVGAALVPSLLPGKAIRDAAINAMIYSNYAHDIADSLAPYLLAINIPIVAVDAPTGTAYAAGTDRLANIYQ